MTSSTSKSKKGKWFVYVLQCADKSLYTGITTSLARRVAEHSSGKLGARYTRSRRPVKLVYQESLTTRSLALKREAAIKKLKRVEKLALISSRAKS